MEKGERDEIGEFPLPETIIQHIQCFLNEKQAAQTSILSKLWYNAWLTRPILDLDEFKYRKGVYRDPQSRIEDGFPDFARQTVQRYQDLNLKMESFRVWMLNTGDRNSLADELIVKMLKMGVNDLNFELYPPDTALYLLPHEVLGSENLIRLSLMGCTIDLPADGKISCSKLKSLSLSGVCIENDMFWGIISSCRLIEKLTLCDCTCSFEVNSLRARMLTLRTPSIESSEFHKLKYLSMRGVNIGRFFFNDFSRKFPCLEDIALYECRGYKRLRIFSHSLKSISLLHWDVLRAYFDVPSIRKFEFSGNRIPSLSFATALGEWESSITISCNGYNLCTKWFWKLKKLLTNLSLSKISLSLELDLEKCIDYVRKLDDSPKPFVENLTVSWNSSSRVSSSILDCLFWSCRAKFITLYWFPKSFLAWNVKKDLLELHRNTLIQSVKENMFAWHDLEAVNVEGVEVFKPTLKEPLPLHWKTLLDVSAYRGSALRIQFRLKWRSPDYA